MLKGYPLGALSHSRLGAWRYLWVGVIWAPFLLRSNHINTEYQRSPK